MAVNLAVNLAVMPTDQRRRFSWRYPHGRIVIFAREPVAGEVKTRLILALGAEGAAQLHTEMLLSALHHATASRLCPVTLCCTPEPTAAFFQRCRNHYPITLKRQTGTDLGGRMHHAFRQALAHSRTGPPPRWAVLIGSDCPQLDQTYLQQAIISLEQGHQAVIGPAKDGGYVLIGLRQLHPALFAGLPWGSDRVLAITRQRLMRLGWRWTALTPLADVDRPEDLREKAVMGHLS